MQVKLLDRQRWRTRIELANAIFGYLEVFHNRQRRHSTLGMLSRIEFENRRPPPWHEEKFQFPDSTKRGEERQPPEP
jgi:hypothetical protein